MKKTIFAFLILALIAGSAVTVYSQDESMQKWMDYATPGEMHKMLAKHSGSFTAKTTFWMAPGTEPMVSEASVTGEMIMDGRYLMSKYSGNMMGMPFNGMAIDGYDNGTKTFSSTWVDNMGTGIMYMTGKWDESAKQISYTGTAYDAMAGKVVNMRQVVSFDNNGVTKMEMYSPGPDGNEFKSMEVTYTKK